MHMYTIEFPAANFAWFKCLFCPPSPALVAYRLEWAVMPLHDAVEVHCKNSATTDTKAQVPIILGQPIILGRLCIGILTYVSNTPRCSEKVAAIINSSGSFQ